MLFEAVLDFSPYLHVATMQYKKVTQPKKIIELELIPCFWCERLEERHALVFFLSTHGVGWGGAVFTFLQLAHAGDAHAMSATVLMGWCGVGLCSRSFNLHTLVMHTPWVLRYSWVGMGRGCVHVPSTCTRHECYGTHSVVWGGAVFMFLQLAHAGHGVGVGVGGWC